MPGKDCGRHILRGAACEGDFGRELELLSVRIATQQQTDTDVRLKCNRAMEGEFALFASLFHKPPAADA